MVTGEVMQLSLTEGAQLKEGDIVGQIDTTQLHLKRKQVDAMISAVKQKLPNEASQLAVFDERIEKLKTELQRVSKLVEANAAPSKQFDDLTSELAVANRQRTATASTLSTQTRGMLSEIEPLRYQRLQILDQMDACTITSPVDGIVLNSFLKKGELAAPGRAIFSIADMDPLTLKAYIGEPQLSEINLGDEVTVLYDGPDGMLSTNGTVSWISDQAEFTPKQIQTQDERTALVYAFKVLVPNDGSLKMGMPAEVRFN